jgi:dual specificity tyrosine-phosphorylation-regulated kinase 2/3/4
MPQGQQPVVGSASQFNFGTASLQKPGGNTSSESEALSFLPPVNFDDLHTSLQLGDLGDFSFDKHDKTNTRQEVALESSKGGTNNPTKSTVNNPGSDLATPPVRKTSLLRSPSKTTTMKSWEAGKTDSMAPPPKMAQQSRPRRQSHFPSSTSSQPLSNGRAPRKSIGPGILANGTSEYSFFNDGLAAKADQQKQEWLRGPRSRETSGASATSRHSLAATGDMGGIPTARGTKAKSMLPPVKFNPDFLQAASSTPEHNVATLLQRSPGRDSYGTPGSSKRMSQHASGLGARTISPTDARRMKRMSQMPNPPPIPQTPPTSMPEPPPPRARSTIDSPSFIPRKSVTPSSNRTTPDHNRKSYSSVISVSSSTSFNSLGKGVNGPTRLQQNASASRLPTLKGRAESAANTVSEMGVPPVPAIPKAYESPKGEPDSPYFPPPKSGLPLDSASVHSSSTLEYVSAPSGASSDREKETPKPEREQRERKPSANNYGEVSEARASGTQDGRRGLQPLQLPPFTLLPSKSQSSMETDKPLLTPVTPPPQRAPPKTPSTPMTASRATFFSRRQAKDESSSSQMQLRSSSSHHALRSDTYPMPSHFMSTDRSAAIDLPPPRKVTSPYTSSSLPKTSGEFPALRTKPSIASVDRIPSTTGTEQRTSRLTGPRALTSTRTSKPDMGPNPSSQQQQQQQQRSPSEADGTSFGNSIRRKLSLTRKRSSSKVESGQVPKPPSHESMPPPKLPASATLNDLSSASSTKTSYLHSRRKSSHPENTTRPERAKSEVFAKDAAVDGASQSISTTRPHATSKNSQSSLRRPGSNASFQSARLQICDAALDNDDMKAEEEMRTLARKRRKTEVEARELDELRRRAVPRDRVSPAQALKAARLNIYERGEIVDYKDVYFCGTQNAKKFAGNLEAENVNFGYDDERGDYNIVIGDHLAYRYEVVDVLGKGSFGQVVRCVDHKTGGLEAIKIIRNKKRFHQQALVEVNILQKIRDWVSTYFACSNTLWLTECVGPGEQVQHGQFHTKLLLPWTSVYIHRAPGYESIRVHQGARLPWLLSQAYSALYEADAELSGIAEKQEGHPLRLEAREHSARPPCQVGDQGHRLRVKLSGERKGIYLHSITLLPLSRGNPWHDLWNANRYVEFGLHSCRASHRLSDIPWRK